MDIDADLAGHVHEDLSHGLSCSVQCMGVFLRAIIAPPWQANEFDAAGAKTFVFGRAKSGIDDEVRDAYWTGLDWMPPDCV